MILTLTGILTIYVTIFFRNQHFFTNIFAIILSASIVFTYFYIYDLEENRHSNQFGLINKKFMMLDTEGNDSSRFETGIASVFIVGLFSILTYLLSLKY